MKLITTLGIITTLLTSLTFVNPSRFQTTFLPTDHQSSHAKPIPEASPSLTDPIELAKRNPQDPECAAEAALDAAFGGSGECDQPGSTSPAKRKTQDGKLYECAIEAAIDVTFGGSGECG